MFNNKSQQIFKTALAILAISAGLFLGFNNTLAQSGDLEVTFNPNPLFNESNFVPGDVSIATATVTNNSAETKKVGISGETTNSSTTTLASALDFKVLENGTILYGDGSATGPKTLADFFSDSPNGIYLSDLGSGQSTTYTLIATFLPDSGNEYQATYTQFDFDIGFFPMETVSGQGGPSGGGGAVSILPSGETSIIGVGGQAISEDNLVIVWLTQDSNGYPKNTYGGVIYGTESVADAALGNPPNYGYQFRKNEAGLPFNSNHSVTLEGLSGGTTYYYRVVSWASPAKVSREYSFTMPTKVQQGAKTPSPNPPTHPSGAPTPNPSHLKKQRLPNQQLAAGAAAKTFVQKGKAGLTPTPSPTSTKQSKIAPKKTPTSFNNLMANLASLASRIPWWLLVSIGVLMIVGIFLTRSKKGKK